MRSLNFSRRTNVLSPLRTPWSFASSGPIASDSRLGGCRKGAVTIRDLVRHALRHRPDHIVVGEVRGGEAADLLQALNTGHGGSLTTVHANNADPDGWGLGGPHTGTRGPTSRSQALEEVLSTPS